MYNIPFFGLENAENFPITSIIFQKTIVVFREGHVWFEAILEILTMEFNLYLLCDN